MRRTNDISVTFEDFKEALETDALEIYFQPIVYGKNKIITGVEALTRWNHKDYGLISPGSFRVFLSDPRISTQFLDWVIESVLENITIINKKTSSKISFYINVDIPQIQNSDFLTKFTQKMDQYELDYCQIVLEITEANKVSDIETLMEITSSLRMLGVKVALDDFGTGFSNIMLLNKLEVDTIKIDRDFVLEMDKRKTAKIVFGILDIAISLNINIVIEGIETQQEYKKFKNYPSLLMQGYFFYRPMACIDLLSYLT